MNLKILTVVKYVILITLILWSIRKIMINKTKILNFFKKISDLKYPFALGVVMLISLIYIFICIYMMFPYLKTFLNNGYIIETNDLPNFSSVFESLFVVLAMISSTLLGYMTYKVSKNQMLISKNQVDYEYNKSVSSPSIIVYNHLKLKLFYDLTKLIKTNISILQDEEYTSVDGPTNAIEILKKEELSFKLSQNINEYVPYILTLFNDDRLVMYFLALIEDINQENDITYVFNDKYVNRSKLKETSSAFWVKTKYTILFGNIDKLKPCLTEHHYKIFKKIQESSVPK